MTDAHDPVCRKRQDCSDVDFVCSHDRTLTDFEIVLQSLTKVYYTYARMPWPDIFNTPESQSQDKVLNFLEKTSYLHSVIVRSKNMMQNTACSKEKSLKNDPSNLYSI